MGINQDQQQQLQMPTHLKLQLYIKQRSQLFENDYDFAWRLLDAECNIHTQKQITMQDITQISELYMKAIQRLNSIQDEREQYFSHKMQKLMAKPYVIRCFNNESEGKKNDREFKRREMEDILTHETEKTNPQRLHHMICQYGEKQKKIKSKIDKIMQEHERKLQVRLKKRSSKIVDRLSYHEALQNYSNEKSNKDSEGQWINNKCFNPQSSRTTVGSSCIQINSP